MAKECNTYGNLGARLWLQSDISITTKIGVYHAYVLTVLLYRCKTWITYKKAHQTTGTLPSKVSPISYENLMANLHSGHCGASKVISHQFLVYYHETRLENIGCLNGAYREIRDGERATCKPRKRFKDCHKKACISTQTCEKKAKDRDLVRSCRP